MSDDEGLGDLFGGAEETPTYPLQSLSICRQALAEEGVTYNYFSPLLHLFDNITSTETAAADEARLRQRLVRLAPPPLEVRYRDKRHSLWGHKLWNAAKYLVKRMDQRMIDVRGKAVLELGAGLGVPTLAAYRNGARLCVVTDYPDADLLDIIALNVEANCQPGDVDADVRHELETLARQQLAAGGSGGGGDVEAVPAAQVAAAVRTRCHVEPLLWGKKEHIEAVLQHTTGGAGYDVVLLSDILFNHVCNDDLADTLAAVLAKNPRAAGYCVFSHHRAYKQLHDFEFFDKCVRRGLHYEQLDEQDYPMMFPEDRGPVSVRQPVKCYKITRRYDDAGCGVDASQRFDVVLQGTGMVQALLSAALARNGLKVLHCDGEDHYAAAMSTFDHSGFLAYLSRPPTAHTDAACAPEVFVDRLADAVPDARRRRRYAIDVLPMCYMARGPLLRRLVSSGMSRSLECQHVHRLLLLQHPATTTSTTTATTTTATTTTTAMEVPLTRAGVFGNTAVNLFDKRRMMRFVKDVEASVAEQLHAKTANPADDPTVANTSMAAEAAAAEAAALFASAAQSTPHITLTEVLQRKYNLAGTALDVVSLMGMMDVLPSAPSTAEPPLVRSVDMVRDLLLSTGAFDGRSPYLTTSFGAAEVPQNLCRLSAVWGGTFVLRRSLRGIAVDEEKEQQYAVLSNGQWVPATVIVAPAELVAADSLSFSVQDWYYDVLKEHELGRTPLLLLPSTTTTTTATEQAREVAQGDGDTTSLAQQQQQQQQPEVVRLSRVVLATKSAPLFTLAALQAAGVVEVDAARDYTAAAPIITALVREPQTQAVVWLVQQSFASDHAPAPVEDADAYGDGTGGPCVLHFTADASLLSQAQLRAYVMRFYVADPASEAPWRGYRVREDDVVLAAAFTIDSRDVAQRGVVPLPVEVPSETRWTHSFGWEESTKLRRANEHDRRHLLHETAADDAGGETAAAGPPCSAATRASQLCRASEHFHLVQVPSLLPNVVYDGHYVQVAEAAHARVLAALGRRQDGDAHASAFLAPLPPE
ncbi:putative methyltransferase/GDP dissociation inhibitor [Novymonas esmeraldas]|uniref:Methyltransferase/GDP dissociation inhibitor n=1 Tax=Novymonas esmeraldas TaxID=1808958 RepID=A0AAW0EQS6_9TRYP